MPEIIREIDPEDPVYLKKAYNDRCFSAWVCAKDTSVRPAEDPAFGDLRRLKPVDERPTATVRTGISQFIIPETAPDPLLQL